MHNIRPAEALNLARIVHSPCLLDRRNNTIWMIKNISIMALENWKKEEILGPPWDLSCAPLIKRIFRHLRGHSNHTWHSGRGKGGKVLRIIWMALTNSDNKVVRFSRRFLRSATASDRIENRGRPDAVVEISTVLCRCQMCVRNRPKCEFQNYYMYIHFFGYYHSSTMSY